MVLKFVFLSYKSDKNYFLKILQKIATLHQLKFYKLESNNEISFFVKGKEENLSVFANAIQSAIPLSLYFIFKNVEASKEEIKDWVCDNAKSIALFDFDLNEINTLKDIENSHFGDIFNYTESKITFDIFYQNDKINTQIALQKALFDICDKLQNNQSISVQTTKGVVSLSLNGDDFDYIMANDISSISLHTRASKEELEALATFEKPTIALNIKELFVSELGFKKALFILPYDVILCMISSILLKKEIPFVYLKIATNPVLHYSVPSVERFFEIVVGQNGYFIHKELMDSAYDVKKIQQDIFDTQSPLIISYLSVRHPTILGRMHKQELINIIHISFDKNPKNIFKAISTRENGSKLIANFKKTFKERFDYIESLNETPQISHNILDILDSISVVLGFEMDKKKVFDLAESYLRSIGPKIDFKNQNINDVIYYDAIPTIRSVMSFSLAGVEMETLSYGVCESLVDYLILLLRDAKMNYSINNMGIMGDAFANKIVFDKLSKKISNDFTLIFPQYLDFKS